MMGSGPDFYGKFDYLIGKTVAQADADLDLTPVVWGRNSVTYVRPVKIDGKDLIITMEVRLDRLNVAVTDGKISQIVDVS